MPVWKWPSIELTGDSQTVPNVCPNCMTPATVTYRYPYRSPLWFLSRTSYFQTFGYCGACAPQMDAWFKHGSRAGCLGFVLYVAAIVGAVLLLTQLIAPGKPFHGEPLSAIVAVTTLLAAFAIPWLVLRLLRRSTLGKHPQRPDQAIQGPAAYYTGQTLGGLGSKHVYRALRPEWLAALVEANPGSVDPAVYRRVTGKEPPEAAARKPFG